MGTINYCSNKYITLGVNVDYLYEEKEELDDNDIYYDEDDYLSDYFDEIQDIIDKYNFEYFIVKLKAGYYEGFYVYIKDYDYAFFDNSYEKNETLKEATKLKKLLIELAENGLVACFPGWCTSYLSKEGSKEEIKEAIKQIKQDIKKIPTYKIYKRNGGF